MTHDTFTERGRAVAEKIVREIKGQGVEARIGTTYRDYRQNWTWETILVQSEYGEYQALNPRQFDMMNEQGALTNQDITDIIYQACK